jgi:hypothetical protein
MQASILEIVLAIVNGVILLSVMGIFFTLSDLRERIARIETLVMGGKFCSKESKS